MRLFRLKNTPSCARKGACARQKIDSYLSAPAPIGPAAIINNDVAKSWHGLCLRDARTFCYKRRAGYAITV